MLFLTDMLQLQKIFAFTAISLSCLPVAYAQSLSCKNIDTTQTIRQICSKELSSLRDQLDTKYITAYLVTNAPLQLLKDTQKLWLNRAVMCKSSECFQQQFELRFDDLNFYTSLNQTLTQHYLKYENGQISKQPIHLQVHQLDKDTIKIEGIAYRNPNNRKENQHVSLLAYTNTLKKSEITDNEKNCHYQFDFQKALLVIKTEQKGCERFSGVYRLYD